MRLADFYLNPFTFVGTETMGFFNAQMHVFRTLCNNAVVTSEKGILITILRSLRLSLTWSLQQAKFRMGGNFKTQENS